MTSETVCPRSSDPFYTVSYFIKRVTTSWTYSMRPEPDPAPFIRGLDPDSVKSQSGSATLDPLYGRRSETMKLRFLNQNNAKFNI